jgi:hypothetical protein
MIDCRPARRPRSRFVRERRPDHASIGQAADIVMAVRDAMDLDVDLMIDAYAPGAISVAQELEPVTCSG